MHAMHTLKTLRSRLLQYPPEARMLEASLAMFARYGFAFSVACDSLANIIDYW